MKKVFGEHHSLNALIWHWIGNVQIRLEKYHDALHAFQNAITIQYHLNSKKDNINATESYAKIGIVYLLQQKYDMSLDIFQKVLNLRITLLGKSHPNTARMYNNIGSIFLQTNKVQKARQFFQLALDTQKNAITKATKSSANKSNEVKNLKLESAMTLINFGNLCKRIHEWEKAEKMFREAYDLQKEVLGCQNLIALTTLKMISESMTRRHCAA